MKNKPVSRMTPVSQVSRLNHLGRHILLTGSRTAPDPDPGGERAYSGNKEMFLVQPLAFLSGITPQTAPGLAVGDFLVVCSDYTGDADYDPYTAPVSGVAAGVLGNTIMSPLFFQTFAALTASVTEVVATMSGVRNGVTVTVSDPFFIDAQGASLAVLPETEDSFGTYVFRLIRIVNVPANPAVAYSGDVFELGITVNDNQLLTWGGAD